jgi:hypothetical protein
VRKKKDAVIDCVDIPNLESELCVGDMVRLTPAHEAGYDVFADYAYTWHVDILWDSRVPSELLDTENSIMGIVLNIYESYPAVAISGLSEADVYGPDFYYENNYNIEYRSESYRNRFKWIRLWCVRGDKGIRLIEVDLNKVQILTA